MTKIKALKKIEFKEKRPDAKTENSIRWILFELMYILYFY